MRFSVALAKLHWFGINWHVFNQSEHRNCCFYIIIHKIGPQAKHSFPPIWRQKWRRSEHVHVSYPGLSFRRPGSARKGGGKKGEFRDWTTSTRKVTASISTQWLVPRETVSFVPPRPSMFPEAKPSGTLRVEGNKTHCLTREQSLSVLLYLLTQK